MHSRLILNKTAPFFVKVGGGQILDKLWKQLVLFWIWDNHIVLNNPDLYIIYL